MVGAGRVGVKIRGNGGRMEGRKKRPSESQIGKPALHRNYQTHGDSRHHRLTIDPVV
jgi:hypothetical protein